MNRLPRPIADWLALWRDLPRYPRQVLLNRAHLRMSTLVIVVAMLADLVFEHPYTTAAVYVALVLLGPSSLVGTAGSVAHMLWDRGLIWADLDCEFCGGGPDEGEDGDPDPDGPDGGDDLIREITEYLHARTTSTV